MRAAFDVRPARACDDRRMRRALLPIAAALALACSGTAPAPEPSPEEPATAAGSATDTESATAAGTATDTDTAPGTDTAPDTDTDTESAAGPTAPPGTLRLLVLGPEELLGSESRALEQLRSALGRGRGPSILVRPTGRERDVAEALVRDGSLEAPAAEWAAWESVLVVRVRPPRATRRGRRVTEGRDRLLLLHPPATTPVYAETTDDGGLVVNARDAVWLRELLPEAP